MNPIHYYRVRQSTTHPKRSVRRAWYGRTWQAEWEGAAWCPRAWTESGIHRKAIRWFGRGEVWWSKHARRRQWVRRHLTRRNDPLYARQRRAGRD